MHLLNLWHVRPREDAQHVPPLTFAMQALQKLDCSHNHITGGLDPLRGCTALTQLWATHNQLVGGLEPLEGCKALQGLCNLRHSNLWEPAQYRSADRLTPLCAPCSVRSLPQSTAGRSRAAPGKQVRRRGISRATRLTYLLTCRSRAARRWQS